MYSLFFGFLTFFVYIVFVQCMQSWHWFCGHTLKVWWCHHPLLVMEFWQNSCEKDVFVFSFQTFLTHGIYSFTVHWRTTNSSMHDNCFFLFSFLNSIGSFKEFFLLHFCLIHLVMSACVFQATFIIFFLKLIQQKCSKSLHCLKSSNGKSPVLFFF